MATADPQTLVFKIRKPIPGIGALPGDLLVARLGGEPRSRFVLVHENEQGVQHRALSERRVVRCEPELSISPEHWHAIHQSNGAAT